MIIAFDVDMTLIDKNDKPREEVIALLMCLGQSKKNHIIVWSGSGKEYAEMWVRRLALERFVESCASKITPNIKTPDIAIDDQDVKLGKYNIKI